MVRVNVMYESEDVFVRLVKVYGKAINGIILKQYEEQYGDPENAVLENTERRFGFIKRKMENFNDRFGKVLPIEWGMDCLLLYEFCSITRIHLTQIL